ncbi:MAG: hypothetical protein IKK97_04120 [Phascolarctobacterium sp.]|nr:hypothetical protein [Phascolarctobacterium sp.]
MTIYTTRKSHFRTSSRRRWWLAAFLYRVARYIFIIAFTLLGCIEF